MTAAQQQPPKAAEPAKRFTLADVTKGKVTTGDKVVAYGPEGVGKSTFAASFPKPIFLCAESGTNHLDVARLPPPKDYEDVLHAVKLLIHEQHTYGTFVVDTVDWLEPLIWLATCLDAKAQSIEKVGGGFGKGYKAALDKWRVVVSLLEQLVGKGMNVVLLGHSKLKTFKNPTGPDFDRYNLSIHSGEDANAAGLLKQWCDLVLFINYEGFALKREGDDAGLFARGKGVATGNRLIFAERTAAFDAKNRHGLKPELPLGTWSDLQAAMGKPDDPERLLARINEALPKLVAAEQEKVKAAVGRAGGDPMKLSQLNNYVQGQLSLATKEN
jgi:hypothetical protein